MDDFGDHIDRNRSLRRVVVGHRDRFPDGALEVRRVNAGLDAPCLPGQDDLVERGHRAASARFRRQDVERRASRVVIREGRHGILAVNDVPQIDLGRVELDVRGGTRRADAVARPVACSAANR